MITAKCLAIFGFGTCFMLFPLTKDLKRSLLIINDNAKRKKNRSKIAKQLPQFIQFHCALIQLSRCVADAYYNITLNGHFFYFFFPDQCMIIPTC